MESLRKLPTTAEVAEVLLLAPKDVPWSYEGRVRAIIRRTLILQEGASWAKADKESRRVVARARSEANIAMPAGWDSPNDLSSWIAYQGCDVCGRGFRPNHASQVYCSGPCKWRGARILERLVTLRRCGHCASSFETDHQPQKMFCSRACQRAAAQARERARTAEGREGRSCEVCGKPLGEELRAGSRFCSSKCSQRDWYLRANPHRKHRTNGNGALNGHDHQDGEEVAPTCPDHDFAAPERRPASSRPW